MGSPQASSLNNIGTDHVISGGDMAGPLPRLLKHGMSREAYHLVPRLARGGVVRLSWAGEL